MTPALKPTLKHHGPAQMFAGVGELAPAPLSCRHFYAYQWWKGAQRCASHPMLPSASALGAHPISFAKGDREDPSLLAKSKGGARLLPFARSQKQFFQRTLEKGRAKTGCLLVYCGLGGPVALLCSACTPHSPGTA